MTDENIKINDESKKIFLLGAGFDKIFGLPLWNELIVLFKGYILSNSETNIVHLEKKLSLIMETNNTLIRKFQMLENIGVNHGYNIDSTKQFLVNVLNINKTTVNKEELNKIFIQFSASDDIFITTNLSNTFISNN